MPESMILPLGPLLHKARQIAHAAEARHARALLVGGWVRDALLGQNPKDADLEVFGIAPEELRRLLRPFGKLNCVGESFRVYKVSWQETGQRLELDISIPRRDRKTGEGHKGFEVVGDPEATFEEAARRRDFTINAIGADPLTGEVLDPFHGRADLENRILRAVDGAHFGEDSLRVLRAMQFAARFELTVEPGTVIICRDTPLGDLPRERLWMEWEKLLLRAARPSLGLAVARELEILSRLFAFLEHAATAETGRRLDAAAALRETLGVAKRPALMLAALVLDDGAEATEKLLDVLGVYSLDGFDIRAATLALVAEIGAFDGRGPHSDGDIRRLTRRCDPPLLLALLEAMGRDVTELRARLHQLDVAEGPPPPLLMGRHLLEMGLAPGKIVGEITRAVYERQLDGTVANLDEALAAAREELAAIKA